MLASQLQLGHNYIGTEHMLLGLVREGEGVAAQVLVSLGADLSEIRQAVIGVLAGQPLPGAASACGASRRAPRDGPRCPMCKVLLDGQVGYRVLAAQAVDQPEISKAIDVLFVYYLRCGVMLAHTSAAEVGLTSDARTQPVGFAQVVWTAAERQRERVIAQGVTDHGVRRTLRAGGDDESYATMLRTEDSAGVIDSGGMGGPKLWDSDRLNVYTGVNPDRGPRGIVVRCDPSIDHLSVVYEDATESDMIACGEADGLRFGVLLVAPETQLREVVGTDHNGTVIDRFNLRGHHPPGPGTHPG